MYLVEVRISENKLLQCRKARKPPGRSQRVIYKSRYEVHDSWAEKFEPHVAQAQRHPQLASLCATFRGQEQAEHSTDF